MMNLVIISSFIVLCFKDMKRFQKGSIGPLYHAVLNEGFVLLVGVGGERSLG